MNPIEPESSITWAQCDSCSKWRKLPPNYPLDQLPNDWVCSMNPNKEFASCSIEEEPYNDIVNNIQNNISNNDISTSVISNNNSTNAMSIPPKQLESGSNVYENGNIKPKFDSLLNMPISQLTDVEIPELDKDYKYYNLDNLLMKVENIELPQLSELKVSDVDIKSEKIKYEVKKPIKHKIYDKRREVVVNRYSPSESYEEASNSQSGRPLRPSRYDDYIKPESKNKNGNFKLRNKKKKVKKELLPLSLVNWVQCEGCKKWRQLPSHVNVEKLPEAWYCKMNIWDPSKADCSIAEDAEPIPGINSNSSSISTGSNQFIKTRKKQKKVESVFVQDQASDFSNVHYVDCPSKDLVAGHPVGDRLVLYSQTNTDMSVCKSKGVAVFSKYPKDMGFDKKRPSADPVVLSFGCKTDWNLDVADSMVSEKQIDNELERVEKERKKFAKNGLSGGYDKLLQLCPNLRGQVGRRKIIPSNWPEKSLLTNIYPMKDGTERVHRQVDEAEAFEKLSAWLEGSKNIQFSPNSPYANMLLCSAVEHVEN